MNKQSTLRPLVFSVVEDDGEDVTIEISEEDYRVDLAAGIDEEDTLRPGRYKMRRGGFLARHPELKVQREERSLTLPFSSAVANESSQNLNRSTRS